MKLEVVRAVVTGAASGLGRATAQRLIQAGARVALIDRRQSDGAAVAAELGDRALFTPADVASGAEVSTALEQAVAHLGGLNVLVNCAGVGSPLKTLGPRGPARLEDFNRVLQTNLVGTFNCIRLAAAQMAGNDPLSPDGERGVIINTASVAAWDGQMGQVAYAASKAGIVGMTLPLARDLSASGIRVVCIAPGLFETPMLSGLPEELRETLGEKVEFPHRAGHPEEFASLVTHALENGYLNGTVLRLDGGIRLPPR